MSSINLNNKELEALRAIRNSLIHRGVAPSMRDLMGLLGYKSPYSISIIIQRLIAGGFLERKDGKLKILKDLKSNNLHARTINVPLVGSAPCGAPLLAEQNIETMIPVSIELAKPSYKHFLLRANGDSMNQRGIEDGDLVLVRQQEIANNGDIVVALIDDDATIKEFERSKDVVLLKPRSKNKNYTPIVVTENFMIQGKVIATITNF